MATYASSGVLGALLALAACGSRVDENALPAVVAQELKVVSDICAEVQGRPDTTAAVKRTDLNGDGDADYVLDVGSLRCEGAAGIFGDRAKEIVVFAGDGKGGATSAYDDFSYGAKLEGDGRDTRLWLTVAAEQCGKPPATDFASEYFCERPLVWNPATRKFDFAPLPTIRMIE